MNGELNLNLKIQVGDKIIANLIINIDAVVICILQLAAVNISLPEIQLTVNFTLRGKSYVNNVMLIYSFNNLRS